MAKGWINEEFGTQMEKTRGDRMKWTRRFTAHAKTEFDAWLEIRKFIVQNYPVQDEQRIHTLTVTENPDGVKNLWSGECTFLSPSLEQRLDEEKIPNYSFSTKGGTAHITNSLQTVKVYPGWRPKLEYCDEDGKRGFRTVKDGGKVEVERETPPNFHGGIGWNEESRTFDGCDITVPSKQSTISVVVDDECVDQNFLKMLTQMTGTVNSAPFDGLAKGECLFLGCDGSRRLREKQLSAQEEEDSETGTEYELVWDLSFEFAAAPNRKQWVKNIGYVNKRGWEYMHIMRRPVSVLEKYDIPEQDNETDDEYAVVEQDAGESEDDSEATTTPVGAYIEQVYPYSDFSLLGLV